METWKQVVGYEGLYEVSNLGRVRSLDREIVAERGGKPFRYKMKGRIIAPQERKHGYLSVCLYGKESKNGRFHQVSVHRIVAEAFIPNPNGYSEVNHIDENKQNNSLSNLEWCDHIYNTNYGTAQKRKAEKKYKWPEIKSR